MTRILVIEDEFALREDIVEMLMFEGYDMLSAGDGEEGLQMAIDQRPDLVISDIAMPRLNGYEVLTRLREVPEQALVPFIFLTARADRSFMRHGMELGADDYLTKPFTKPELLAAVQTRLVKREVTVRANDAELEQARMRIARLITHELRTPLSQFMMVQDVIARQSDRLEPEALDDLLGTLRAGSQRLFHLVEQVVFTTHIETGVLTNDSIKLAARPVQSWELLTASVMAARSFAYRNREAFIHMDDRDPAAEVLCKLDVLRFAIAEIMANALVFSPNGSDIHVIQWVVDNDVYIAVKDSGSGMTAEQMQHALRDFEQIDRHVTEQQGLGLGLPLARRLIELHGGTLDLRSVVDQGTQVTIRLPRVHEQAGH